MLKQVMYSVLGLGAAGTLSLCDLCQPQAARATTVAAVGLASALPTSVTTAVRSARLEVRTVHLKVAGMTCGGCVVGTRTVLTRLHGVTKAEVSYEKQDALVTYDPAKVTIAQIVAAIKTLGYTATVAG